MDALTVIFFVPCIGLNRQSSINWITMTMLFNGCSAWFPSMHWLESWFCFGFAEWLFGIGQYLSTTIKNLNGTFEVWNVTAGFPSMHWLESWFFLVLLNDCLVLLASIFRQRSRPEVAQWDLWRLKQLFSLPRITLNRDFVLVLLNDCLVLASIFRQRSRSLNGTFEVWNSWFPFHASWLTRILIFLGFAEWLFGISQYLSTTIKARGRSMGPLKIETAGFPSMYCLESWLFLVLLMIVWNGGYLSTTIKVAVGLMFVGLTASNEHRTSTASNQNTPRLSETGATTASRADSGALPESPEADEGGPRRQMNMD